MLDELPSLGASIEMVVPSALEESEHFLAKIMDETPGGYILASFEAGEGFALPELNTTIRIRFNKRDAGYEFDTILLQKKESPFRMAYIAKPKELLRRQLRAYLRVDCAIPVEVIRRDDKKRDIISGTITNLSGGGMLISIRAAVPPEVMLELKFDLGGGVTIANVSARTISIRAGDGGAKIHVLQLEAIDEDQRTAIVRHTFELQRKAKRAAKV